MAGPAWNQEPAVERPATRPVSNDVIRLQYAVADEVANVIGQALSPTFQRNENRSGPPHQLDRRDRRRGRRPGRPQSSREPST